MTAIQPLTPFAEGVWLASEPVRIVGTRLATNMAALRLGDGGLLLWSPVPMTPARRAAVEALGPVRHLYAPNTFHHLWIGEWAAAFPAAKLHGPARLAKKRRDLQIGRFHGAGQAPEPAFEGVVEEIPVDGFRLDETALLYRPARALLVADLAHNVGRPTGRWTVAYTRMMGFYDRVALSRVLRWTAFSDRTAARQCLADLLERPFDRLVVGHGTPVAAGGQEALAGAYGWLLAGPRR